MATGTVNAFSVDVEDWYQVADFDAVVGFADWDRYESRVARNADRSPHVIPRRAGGEVPVFPLAPTRLFGRNVPLAGGGWLSVFPYRYTRWAMRRVNREGHPAVAFVHPWELDPEQPRMRTAGRRGFSTHYVGLRGTYGKLRRLFRDFRFAPLRDVLGL